MKCKNKYKTELDKLLFIDMTKLKAIGFIDGYKSGHLTWKNTHTRATSSIAISFSETDLIARLTYNSTDLRDGTKIQLNYPVELETTPCYFGGKRYWFLCPILIDGDICGARVRVLYCKGLYFGCRDCHKLTYASQNVDHHSFYAPLYQDMRNTNKAIRLKQTIKRPYYNGTPTKKMRYYTRLIEQSSRNEERMNHLERLLFLGVR